MKKAIIYILVIVGVLSFSSCRDDDPSSQSIFDTNPPARNAFDNWLLDNYTYPYNIDFKYKMEDIESSYEHDLVPADEEKSKKLAKLIKYAWLDAYVEALEENGQDGYMFLKRYVPKTMHLIGSPGYNQEGTQILGTAEGGMKVTLYAVNKLTIEPDWLNSMYFHTMHHEFAHILHQTKNYSTDYKQITEGKYVGENWYQISQAQALQSGFITNYSMSYPDEDFVEIFSRYLTYSPFEWNYLLDYAGDTGGPLIKRKFDIVKAYLNDSWSIDIEVLRSVVQRRTNSLDEVDLDNL